jgi:hypothetical protein
MRRRSNRSISGRIKASTMTLPMRLQPGSSRLRSADRRCARSISQGEDLFVGKDVAATLGYGNTQGDNGHC